MIKLKNLLSKKIIKEATTSGQATGARKSKGTTSTDYSKAQSDYDTHMKSEPSKTRSYSRQVSDMTKWIHPWSNKTTTLGKGQAKPSKGWKITTTQQAKKTEPLKKLEPAKKVEPSKSVEPLKKVEPSKTADPLKKVLSKLEPAKKVDQSKSVEPLKKVEPEKKVDPGKQLAQWQDPKKAVAEPAKAEPAKAQPSVATTSTTYGQGSDTDYATAVKGKSAGQTYSAARSTTNPTTTQTGTEDNPDWATWDAKRQSYDTEKQTQKSKDTKSKAAQPLSQIGYGTSGGGMRGKGGGKGKGKGKGKDKKKD